MANPYNMDNPYLATVVGAPSIHTLIKTAPVQKRSVPTKEKKHPRDPKISLFFITINSNKKYTKPDGKKIYDDKIFGDAIDDMFTAPNLFGYKFLKLNRGRGFNEVYDDDEPENFAKHQLDPLVLSNIVNGTVEVGPKLQFVHLHAIWRIKHKTNIHLNIPKIQEHFSRWLNVTKVHLDIKTIANGVDKIMGYIDKNLEDDDVDGLIDDDPQPYDKNRRGTGISTRSDLWDEHILTQ